jgi:hypothetical protein
VLVFEDNHPINGFSDAPAESGLGGFHIQLYEAGGTYGASGGQVSQDAFGNPLGTTYDAAGNVIAVGDNQLITAADGTLLIKNLAPAKYTVLVIPPAGGDWHQVTTIEGTPGVDAWIKANNAPFLQEFGPTSRHVEIGFVKTTRDTSVLTGGSTITGRIVTTHYARPPLASSFAGEAVAHCWVGLNETVAGTGGKGVFAASCADDSTFAIADVPPGTYQLVVWDQPLDMIISFHAVAVPAGAGTVALGDVPVPNWFARMSNRVFSDTNQNGFPDAGEKGIPNQTVNLRFRDGSIYASMPTDSTGVATFSEVFPFFNWFVSEVDYARFKATGATVVVDEGGAIPPHTGFGGIPSFNQLTPQPQPDNGGALYRTETGPVLLQGYQAFAGETNRIEWGKVAYDVTRGENGGITGIVHYATTRAENDPRYAVAENWEPGIPHIQINLYTDTDKNGVIDDTDKDGIIMLADVDNYPFGNFPATEDTDRDGNGVFDLHDAVQTTTTDAWDDHLPSGCVGASYAQYPSLDCFDGLRNFNQIRPAVFDGGYAFGRPAGNADLAVGTYIVEAVAPPGYEHVKEQDKNVDFGDSYSPAPQALPPACVGDPNVLPATLSLFPGQVPTPFYDPETPDASRPFCDRKQVRLSAGQNAAADFFLFTVTPISAHITGVVTVDTANQPDPAAPTFGEKATLPFAPISIQDWTGREITRVYTDAWGAYNALVPSSYSVNIAVPSGVSPNMLTACINSPGPIKDPVTGALTLDPWFKRVFAQQCYTLQFMPGKTTFLDTPIIPIAAGATALQYPVDCEAADGTPVLYSANYANYGPWVPYTPSNTSSNTWPVVTLVSAGNVAVPNPLFDGANQATVTRDFGFGNTPGRLTVGGLNVQAANILSWTNDMIVFRVRPQIKTGQLVIRRGDNARSSIEGITLTVAASSGELPPTVVPAGGSIQAAIDSAPPGSLISIAPGTYDEAPVVHKKIRLQGWGAQSTIISPLNPLPRWRAKIASLWNGGTNPAFDFLPAQSTQFDANTGTPLGFLTSEGPTVTVLANTGEFDLGGANTRARIDGLTITGSLAAGGGVFVNGNAHYLEISNNRIANNLGAFGGGIRIGHPNLISGNRYVSAGNSNVSVHHNQVLANGALDGAGAGIALYTGSDSYLVTDNYICGNFAQGHGGGIGHQGYSPGAQIARNTLMFNHAFTQGRPVSGGAVYIGGLPDLGEGASPGAGNVLINANLIRSNYAGAGDGGGIRLDSINGLDVYNNRDAPSAWYRVDLFNNIIVNNIAGFAGGGISLQDALNVVIRHNTVANNDSTATAAEAFAPANRNQSIPQPAGIVARATTLALYNVICSNASCSDGTSAATPYKLEYSDPRLANNILWRNRSLYWTLDPASATGSRLAANPAQPFWDLAVLGTSAALPPRLKPVNSLLTDRAGYAASNISADPRFFSAYVNTGPGRPLANQEPISSIVTARAFDEGGNDIDVFYGPLYPAGNYHIRDTSPARGIGAANSGAALARDFDGQVRPRPAGSRPDAGADER